MGCRGGVQNFDLTQAKFENYLYHRHLGKKGHLGQYFFDLVYLGQTGQKAENQNVLHSRKKFKKSCYL